MKFLDPKNIQDVLVPATAALTGIGALVGLVYADFKWLAPALTETLGSGAGIPLAVILPVLAALLLTWGAYRAVAKKSKLLRVERFDLRVRKADELLGRDEDIAHLKGLVENASLVLVDGESGCGKSSLIAYGLVPKLNEDGSKLTVLVASYGGDWDLGFAGKIFEAIWSGLSKEDREKIGFAERPAVGSVDARLVQTAFEQIGVKFGRLPVLILDQFDDYQLVAREKFLGARKEWLKPAELTRKNRTWAAIRDLVQAQKIRLVVVTRSDARAGLHSVQFGGRLESTTIGRLGAQWLAQWLVQIADDDGKGEVIANPDAGWTDLRARLERDLTPVGAAAGVVLPQQVRIVFLGLAKLKSLTLSDYRKEAATGGVEALYVHHAIKSAASASGCSAR
jgi:hypothetical protein